MNATSQSQKLIKRSKIMVYFLAAPEEEDECQSIRKYLVPAIRNSKIPVEIYSDFEIPAGEDKAKYKQKLMEADIVLALISSDYISDDETYERTQRVMERYNNNETILVPILVRNCMWKHTPFEKLSLLPKNLQPLNNKQFWNSEDDALMAVVEDIYEAINDFSVDDVQQAEPTIKPEVAKEKEPEPISTSTSVSQEIIIENPEQLINGTEITEDSEFPAEEFIPLIEPEKIVSKPKQTVVTHQNIGDDTQTKKQKSVTAVEVDWRKQYYKRVNWKRFWASVIDQIITVIPTFYVGFVIAAVSLPVGNEDNMSNSEFFLLFLITISFYLIVCAIMESSKWRGTFGKMIMKLQITERDGSRISFIRAFWRNVAKLLVAYSFILIFPIFIQRKSFKKTKKLFHDQLSNTVIGERLKG